MNPDYDLAIIGGGINGAAIARDAALRGLKTILLEKKDFGCGASSKNSKLVHGGLRYLKSFQFRLIKESLKERAVLLQTAPNLVHPLPFIVPSYSYSPAPFWLLKLGLSLYDFLSPEKLEKHQNLTAADICSFFPALKKEKLKGGCLYFDALMQDNRIVIENILSAESAGADIRNYHRITDFISDKGKVCGIQFQDDRSSSTGTVLAKTVVNSTGAWSNQFLSDSKVYPTKGVHLVLPPLHPTHALLLTAPQDNRVFFVIPWNGYTLLGTTDTPYEGDPDAVQVEQADIDYLLTAFRSYFPDLNSAQSSVIAQFAALRPLIKSNNRPASDISRDYQIDLAPSGLISIFGGKYTTYRLMAEKVVDAVFRQQNRPAPACQTQRLPLCKFELSSEAVLVYAKECRLSIDQVLRLGQQYGEASLKIFAIIKANPSESEPICSEHPHIRAELTHAIQNEKAVTPEDWFERRTSIAYTKCKGQKCLAAVAQRFRRTEKIRIKGDIQNRPHRP